MMKIPQRDWGIVNNVIYLKKIVQAASYLINEMIILFFNCVNT